LRITLTAFCTAYPLVGELVPYSHEGFALLQIGKLLLYSRHAFHPLLGQQEHVSCQGKQHRDVAFVMFFIRGIDSKLVWVKVSVVFFIAAFVVRVLCSNDIVGIRRVNVRS
jgi:hypothetical protein